MSLTPEELRPLSLFQGLSDPELEWFAEHAERIELPSGAHMFERGQPAQALWVVVSGVIKGFEEVGGQWLLVATSFPGDVTGMIPFSRMTHYPRHTVADERSVVLRLDVSRFRELMDVSEEVVSRLVALMSDRVRGDVRLEQQGEKMMALGRLSAGLAHELNNPAAAIRSASSRLSEHRVKLPALVVALASAQLDQRVLVKLQGVRTRAGSAALSPQSALERDAEEDALSTWLERWGMEDAWQMAGTLAEARVEVAALEGAVEGVPDAAVGDVLAWLSAGIESDRMVLEINQAAARVSELISSIKTYSHMDRSSEHRPTDVRTGIDSTLTMLGHKLRNKGVQLTHEYGDGLPLIPAHEGELNQVWTNLIDNAIDAVDEGGTLEIRARRQDVWVEVEIIDNGPGIAEEIRAQVFEPFFTTKEVGVGTGLGLGIANRIVSTHQGHIEVRSRPGETVMCVRLPIERTVPGESSPGSEPTDVL